MARCATCAMAQILVPCFGRCRWCTFLFSLIVTGWNAHLLVKDVAATVSLAIDIISDNDQCQTRVLVDIVSYLTSRDTELSPEVVGKVKSELLNEG